MNLRSLQAFYLVVTRGSVVAAAQAMGASQPTVSRLIGGLERQTRLTLFYRSRRRLTLTEDGERFFQEAERIISQINDLERIARNVKQARTMRLRIVCVTRTAASLVAPAAASFARAHPSVAISIHVQRRREIENWIVGRHYDVGVTVLPVSHSAIRTTPLIRASAAVLMRKDSPLARKRILTLSDVAAYPVVAPLTGALPRQHVDEMFAAEGLEPNYSVEASSSQLVLWLVESGLGVSILDWIVVRGVQTDSLTVRQLRPQRWTEYGVLFPRDQEKSRMIEAFLSELKSQMNAITSPGRLEAIL